MSFTDRIPFEITGELVRTFQRVRKSKPFACSLCGHAFRPGDIGRWIYANGTPEALMGNFFVCGPCDGPDAEVIKRAIGSYANAVKLAKQWGIYGPDWNL